MELGELYPRVAIEVPGIALFNIKDAVSEAAYEFCRGSRAWRGEFGPIEYQRDVGEYTLTLPRDAMLVEPTRVELDGKRLPSGSFWSLGTDQLGVVTGLSGHELSGEVAVAPSRLADEMPERLMYEFGDALVYGALSRLLRVPQAEWSDLQRALGYEERFELMKERAATRVENGFKHNRTRVVRYGGL
jgi:hypothetical protein